MKQDDIFVAREGNNWFARNKIALEKKSDNDNILELLRRNSLVTQGSKVLEVGCSNGFRLNRINKEFGCDCYGVDASLEAIEAGSRDFPGVRLSHGGAEDLNFEKETFDLVIINFVLHWIDRKNLLKVISELDRVLKVHGQLVIGDFYPAGVEKVRYHHLPDEQVFTYKQHYFKIFLESQLYSLEHLQSFHHAHPMENIRPNLSDRCFLSLLRKEGDQLYANK